MNTKTNLMLFMVATLSILFVLTVSIISQSKTPAPGSVVFDGDAAINNNIQNNIDSENAIVENSIDNQVNNGETNEIDNNVLNNISVSVDVTVKNAISNQVDKDGKGSNGNGTSGGNGSNNGNANGDSNGNGDSETPDIVWGVDSASLTDDELLACVRDNFGNPEVWGRYLGDKDGVSFGLTQEEVELLQSNDIQILVIWNQFNEPVGFDKGQSEASAAIELAREFGIPEGVALFANVEPIYPIDDQFILGWHETMMESEYNSGIYGIFSPSEELYTAYVAAAEQDSTIYDEMYIWTASPNEGITTEANAPAYNPEFPEGGLIGGWQYGIDAETCNIDTNWFDGNVLDVLW
ncbi:DUF1906 domain-containing protein [Alkalihalophilus pseudofirmus]|uniref:DUF1906 domain-containing protein n=1 Tax=Alkalihalophilus pseudofirmus TaxID=79885 RepID=A0AAJ2NJY5_ALKPS|nr:glycoside hydrolase domain-containing protein [Alkalihalophilus pseudofirmus]MDV2883626.1 DUF1906 domain-containing protein [Alkalihalophilus pseudofirmus]